MEDATCLDQGHLEEQQKPEAEKTNLKQKKSKAFPILKPILWFLSLPREKHVARLPG